MSNCLFAYIDEWRLGTLGGTSNHPNFPFANTGTRRLTSPWRSAWQETVGGGYFEITASNQNLYFNEGGGSFTAVISLGSYNTYTLLAEIKTRMEAVGAHTYTPSYDYATDFKFTITDVTGTFELEGATAANAIWDTIGYDSVDTGLAAAHEADFSRIHTYEYIESNFGAEKSINIICALNINIQTVSHISFQFSNNAFVSIDYEVTPDRYGNNAVKLFTTALSYQYVRVYIVDVDNPAGYVQVGRVWVGETFIPEVGISRKFGDNPKDLSIVTQAYGGEASSIQNPRIKQLTYKFDIAEPWADFEALWTEVGTSKVLIFIRQELAPNVSTFDTPAEYMLYGHFTNFDIKQVAGEKYTVSLSIAEER